MLAVLFFFLNKMLVLIRDRDGTPVLDVHRLGWDGLKLEAENRRVLGNAAALSRLWWEVEKSKAWSPTSAGQGVG